MVVGVRGMFLIQLLADNALYKIVVGSALQHDMEIFFQLFLSEFNQRVFSKRCHNMNAIRLRDNVC